MAIRLNEEAVSTFEMIDVYDTSSMEDLERLAENTTGSAHERALKMMEAYDAYLLSVRDFYEKELVPAFEEEGSAWHL